MRLLVRALAIVASCAALAGQLHIREYGLTEVSQRGETVVVGKLLGVLPDGRRSQILELEVTAAFGARTAEYKPGQRVKVTTYPGVVWDDPGKSPIEHRLRGARHEALKPGLMLAAVPAEGGPGVELLDADDALLRKLSILFEARAGQAYPDEPDEKLLADLADADLARMARDALKKRGHLSTRALLGADRRFLYEHYRALGPQERGAFATAAVGLVEKEPALRDRAAEVLMHDLVVPVIPALARLARLYDARKEDEFRALDDLRSELLTLLENAKGARPDLSPMADLLLAWQMYRPSYRASGDDDAPKLTACFTPAAKARLAALMLENAYANPQQIDDAPDRTLIDEAARLAIESPSPTLIAPLSKIDPFRQRTYGGREETTALLTRIAKTLLKANPSQAPKLRALIARWRRIPD
jgi:hypothetical protein